jgi:hypothetical protein
MGLRVRPASEGGSLARNPSLPEPWVFLVLFGLPHHPFLPAAFRSHYVAVMPCPTLQPLRAPFSPSPSPSPAGTRTDSVRRNAAVAASNPWRCQQIAALPARMRCVCRTPRKSNSGARNTSRGRGGHHFCDSSDDMTSLD